MSCAGCDDCPNNHWHLHATVKRESFNNDWKRHFATDCERIGVRPVRVMNICHDADGWFDPKKRKPTFQSYEECIPTLSISGNEDAAARALGKMARMLGEMHYKVTRLKMEASPNVASLKRMLYAETHIKVKNIMGLRAHASILRVPVSRRVPLFDDGDGHFIVTGRYQQIDQCHDFIEKMKKEFKHGVIEEPRVEIAIYDSNPELDKAWLAQ